MIVGFLIAIPHLHPAAWPVSPRTRSSTSSRATSAPSRPTSCRSSSSWPSSPACWPTWWWRPGSRSRCPATRCCPARRCSAGSTPRTRTPIASIVLVAVVGIGDQPAVRRDRRQRRVHLQRRLLLRLRCSPSAARSTPTASGTIPGAPVGRLLAGPLVPAGRHRRRSSTPAASSSSRWRRTRATPPPRTWRAPRSSGCCGTCSTCGRGSCAGTAGVTRKQAAEPEEHATAVVVARRPGTRRWAARMTPGGPTLRVPLAQSSVPR